MIKQPAQKSYVFDKGYRDVGTTFATTWSNTFAPVSKELSRLGTMFSDGRIISGIFTFLIDLIVFGAVTLFNILLNSAISLFLIAGFLILAPVVYIGFVLVWLSDFLYRSIKRISSNCSNCQYEFDLPVYKCPHCGEKHTRLVPGSYGIFMRKCNCGNKIPTTFFNGRQKLESICPNCGLRILDGGKHVDISIPVIGGPSAGKTCYINMTISQLEKTALKNNNLVFEYAYDGLNDYKSTIELMRNHHLPDKTSEMRLQYYRFYLTPRDEKVKRLMSLCDIGGEVYQDVNVLGSQIGYRYANALIIIIDPLSISELRKELEKRLSIEEFGASTVPIDDILSRLVAALENMYSITSKVILNTDVAVVFTKCDINGLDEMIGKKAVTDCMRNKNVSQEEAANIVCEAFLRKYGENNFVNNAKSKFHSVQYFTCSSLGYGNNELQYIPDGVETPVLWIYRKIFGKEK